MSSDALGHGGEIYAIARRMRTTPESFLDFSSNANIFAKHITARLTEEKPYPFEHYPDSRAAALIEAIAAHEDSAPERILPGNGAADLIWLFLRALEPRKIFFIGPVFSEHIRACQAFGIAYEIRTPPPENDFIPTPEDLEALWKTDADLVILCTPNNPAASTYDNILSLLRMLRAPRALIDLSYREFLYGTDDYYANSMRVFLETLRPGVSLFTLHSFTKFFCCPGIRLGYLMGERTALARMAAKRPSWTVSPFAQQMGIEFLAHVDEYRDTLPSLFAAVAHMGRELRRLDCVNPERVIEGPGFLCCELAPRFTAAKVCKTLLNRRLLVRNCDGIPGMPEGYIRMQARPDEDSAHLLAVLDAIGLDTL